MIEFRNLIHGRFIKRYKRFLVDVKLDSGQVITAHCPNSGSMKSCLEENAEVFLSPVSDPKRKTRYTWEMIKINNSWVGINTSIPNNFAALAMAKSAIPGLEGYNTVRKEVKYRDSRLDLFASRGNENCFIEVKNVTLNENGVAMFPDAVTSRGLKHLKTLAEVKKEGMRAVMLYLIQRTDVESFSPAFHIDPDYASTLKEVALSGVEIIPFQVEVTPEKIIPLSGLPFEL